MYRRAASAGDASRETDQHGPRSRLADTPDDSALSPQAAKM